VLLFLVCVPVSESNLQDEHYDQAILQSKNGSMLSTEMLLNKRL